MTANLTRKWEALDTECDNGSSVAIAVEMKRKKKAWVKNRFRCVTTWMEKIYYVLFLIIISWQCEKEELAFALYGYKSSLQ